MFKLPLVFLLILSACSAENGDRIADKNAALSNMKNNNPLEDTTVNTIAIDSTLIYRRIQDSVFSSLNFTDVCSYNAKIKIDLKYRTPDNFFKMQLYKRLDRAFLSDEVAKKLGACQDYLSRIDSSLFLLVFDAARPVNVQKKMWKALDSIPPKLRGRFVSSGRNLGMHNMGLAVDITICDATGKPLDMGAGFDEIKEIAYPSKESYYLQTGELTLQQVENRKLLRKVMTSQGFWNLSTEWWHFTIGRHKNAVKNFPALLYEPGFEK
jgi:D-alanyl-D-alanine dipeptidase